MNLRHKMYAVTFTTLVVQGAFAEDVKIVGTVKQRLKQTQQEGFYMGKGTPETEIQLLRVELSDEAKSVLESRAQDAARSTPPADTANSALPAAVKLGMNHVPVLNQGVHGTCTTFAITGAVDAILGKGDYVSQLCQLQLSTYLQQQGQGYNDWNGAAPINVLHQMEQHGIANKSKQHAVGCGGYYHYPTNHSVAADSYMETSQFQAISESVFGTVATWSEVPASLTYNSVPAQTLADVKEALNNGNRVVFATLLPRTDLGTSGAVGKHNTWFAKDTWVLTPDILAAAPSTQSAHEMIITGYDDNAVAKDSNGVKHQGLFILRNSWGWMYGYWGEFYMSYDYFQFLVYDVKQIAPYKAS